MFFVLIYDYTLCLTSSPCCNFSYYSCNFSYYNYISIRPYYIVINFSMVTVGIPTKDTYTTIISLLRDENI